VIEHYDGFVTIAVGVFLILYRESQARSTLNFWGTAEQKAKGVTGGLLLFHGFIGFVFVAFGLVRLFRR
jgi:uncharacterized membrane protein HdeD (DUF308 family)